MEHQKSISTYQMVNVLIGFIVGVGVLTLPRNLTREVDGPDGWISLIIAAAIVLLVLFFIIYMFNKHNVQDFLDYLSYAYGKWLGKLIAFLLSVYFVILAGWQSITMSEMVRYFLLETTPFWIMILLILLLSCYLAVFSIQTTVRVICFFVPFSLFIIFLILMLGFYEADFKNILPIGRSGIKSILFNVSNAILPFQGLEIFFFFFPYLMNRTKSAYKSVSITIFVTTFLYVTTFLIVVSVLTMYETRTLLWPTITYTHSAENLTFATQRLDSLLLTTWVLQFFITIAVSLICSSFCLKKIAPILNRKVAIFIIGAIAFAIGMSLESIQVIIKVSEILQYTFLVIFFVLPFVTYLFASIRRRLSR
ncbi:hypothetical protein BTS2_0174 [Bacillus sp. TS-2]|nr:hypothetical protein BTS2_0174 [Bacillus sp. TS-2]